MKFWQRAFLSILLLFTIGLYVIIFFVSDYSYRTGLDSERRSSCSEAYRIAESLKTEMKTIVQYGHTIDYCDYSIFRTYTDYYIHRNIYLELWENDKYLLGNINIASPIEKQTDTDYQVSTVKTVGERKILFAVTAFTFESKTYTLIYAHELLEFCHVQNLLTRFLIISGASLLSCFAVGLFLILRRISKPIEILDKTAQSISNGDYSIRIPEKGNDEISALAGHFNRMTDEIQKKINELNRTAQQKQSFIDNMAHELRTPLTTIRGYAEYLKNANITEYDRVSALDYIVSETIHLEQLKNKLLDLALLRNKTIEFSKVNAGDLISEAAERLKQKLWSRKIKLQIEVPPLMLEGDKSLLESLFGNLLDNAINASFDEGTIEINGHAQNNTAVISIQDHGKGISQEDLERLTEPFFRVDKARARSEGGVGLGLPLCRQIVEVHHAKMFFSSEAGKGTIVKLIFTISF